MKRAAALLLLLAATAPGCGKKGPPRPPLRLVPAAATDLQIARRGRDVHLRFVLPKATAAGEGRLDLDRVEVYAITLAPGEPEPANAQLLAKRFLVGTIDVRPEPGPNEAPPPSQSKPQEQPPEPRADTRPGAGEAATFADPLTAEKLAPVRLERPRDASAPLTMAAWLKEPPRAPYATRVYVVRGVTRNGRPGNPSRRVTVPLVEPPPPPAAPAATFSETAVTLSWTPPEIPPPPPPSDTPRATLTLALSVLQTTAAAAVTAPYVPPPALLLLPSAAPAAALPPVVGFKVYAKDADSPLTASPIAASTYERPGVEFGKEECFVVRTVQTFGTVPIESEPSEPSCVTPVDTFPPRAPQRLSAVAGSGVINLIWDANTEADLAGYLVLRGEAPGDTLQPLTPEPIRETSFRDATVTPGVRYVYAVVAVDRASPPNRSGQSNRVEETAR